MNPNQTPEILPDETVVFRAYSRKLDQDGRAQFHDFVLRDNEDTLSVALTPEKALGDLNVRGYVPITVGEIRALSTGEIQLDVVKKQDEEDDAYLEIVGIPHEHAEGMAITLASRAGSPIERPDHRARIRAMREQR